jgi:hypothetical protein
MKNFFQKIPLLLSVLFFIVVSFVFTFFFREINNNNQKAMEGITKWQTEADRRDEIISLDRSLQENAGERAQLDTHFAQSSDVVPFLDTIEKLAGTVGAVAQVDSVDTGNDYQSLLVGLKASGSFEAIYKFLTLLENSPYELDFLSMDIHKMTPDVVVKGAQDSKWEAVFKIKLLTFIP